MYFWQKMSIVCIVVLCFVNAASQDIIKVIDYNYDLNAAVNAADDGDIILFPHAAITLDQPLNCDKRLTFLGQGPNYSVLTIKDGNTFFLNKTSTVEGLTFDFWVSGGDPQNYEWVDLITASPSAGETITIKRNVFRGAPDQAIIVGNGSNGTTIIENNIILQNRGAGELRSAGPFIIRNNIINQNENGFTARSDEDYDPAIHVIASNNFFENAGGHVRYFTHQSNPIPIFDNDVNLSLDPQLIIETNYNYYLDFRPAPTSPCIDAGMIIPGTTDGYYGSAPDMGYYEKPDYGIYGEISGQWSNSPVIISGDVRIPQGQTLIIDPGVEVRFDGHYMFIVRGTLNAIGTETENIHFTRHQDTEESKWWGIRFKMADPGSIIEYCSITDAVTKFKGIGFESGGGLYIEESSPTVAQCLIKDNAATPDAGYGGGIFIAGASAEPVISNNIIMDNIGQTEGGGICAVGNSNPDIYRNVVTGNTATWGGGIALHTVSCTLTNNTVSGNHYNEGGCGGVHVGYNGTPTLVNNIVYGNDGDQVFSSSGSITVNYSDIQGGWTGSGDHNIDADPLFVDQANGDFQLQEGSPCIDAGTEVPPITNGYQGNAPDLGAFESPYIGNYLVLHLDADIEFQDLSVWDNPVGEFNIVPIVDDQFGKAYSFNGSNYLAVDDINNSLDMSSDFTIEAFVKPSLYDIEMFLCKGNRGIDQTGNYLRNYAISRHGFTFSGRTFGITESVLLNSLNSWSAIALVKNGNNLSLYSNGMMISDGAYQLTDEELAEDINDLPLFIGTGFNTGPGGFEEKPFHGLLDEIRIHRRALDVTELQALPTGDDPFVAYTYVGCNTYPGGCNVTISAKAGDKQDFVNLASLIVTFPDGSNVTLNTHGNGGYDTVYDYQGQISQLEGNYTFTVTDNQGNTGSRIHYKYNVLEEAVIPLYPADQASINETEPIFQWEGITDDKKDIQEYEIMVTNDDGNYNEYIWHFLINANDQQFYNTDQNLYSVQYNFDNNASAALEPNKAYRWNVKAHPHTDNTSEMGWPSFMIIDQASNLVLHLDANNGFQDLSDYGNHVTFNEGVTIVDDGTGNNAYYLQGDFGDNNGEKSHMMIPDDPSLDISDDMTMSVMIKPDEMPYPPGEWGYICDIILKFQDEPHPDGIQSNYGIYWILSQLPPSMGVRTPDGAFSLLDVQTSYTEWIHFAVVIQDGGFTVKPYLNGVPLNPQQPSKSAIGPINDGPLFIGGQKLGEYSFKGFLDDIRIYNRALTDEEVADLYGGPSFVDIEVGCVNSPFGNHVRSHAIVFDPQGLGNIKEVQIISPDGYSEILEDHGDGHFRGGHNIDEQTNPLGIYTLRVENHDGHWASQTIELNNYVEECPDAINPSYDSYIAEVNPIFQWHEVRDESTELYEYEFEVQRIEPDGNRVRIWYVQISAGDATYYDGGDDIYSVPFNFDGTASENLQAGQHYNWNAMAVFEDWNQSHNGYPEFYVLSDTESPIILSSNVTYSVSPNRGHLNYNVQVNDPQGVGDISSVLIRFPDESLHDFQNDQGGGNYDGWYNFDNGHPQTGDYIIEVSDGTNTTTEVHTFNSFVTVFPGMVYPTPDDLIAETAPVFQWHGIENEVAVGDYKIEVQREEENGWAYVWHGIINLGDYYDSGDNLYQVPFNFNNNTNETL